MLQNKPNEISQIKQSSKLLGIEWRLNTGKNFQKNFFENHSEEMRSIHEWSNKVKMTFKNSRSQTLHGLTMINHIDYGSWPYKDHQGALFRYGSGARVEKTQTYSNTLSWSICNWSLLEIGYCFKRTFTLPYECIILWHIFLKWFIQTYILKY